MAKSWDYDWLKQLGLDKMSQSFTLEPSYAPDSIKNLVNYPEPCPLLYIYFAKEAKIAIILCKHPSKDYCLILWDTAKDTFIKGQWLRKGRIAPQRAQISHNGLYWRYILKRCEDNPWPHLYEIISKPPYFTAISLRQQDRGGNLIKGHKPTDQTWSNLSLINGQMGTLANTHGSFKIFADKGQILKDGQVILDVVGDQFMKVLAPYPPAT